jgi:cardiolipin synthase C
MFPQRGNVRTEEPEMDHHEIETAGHRAAGQAAAGSRQTGVSLVSDNLIAIALRVLSARSAKATLDLQYYTWADDVTGRLLAREVLRAADRGVRVRLLLDDLWVRGGEGALTALAQHPSIEVRLFNPFHLRSWGALGTAIELVSAYRVNHRMHNKAWIVDGDLFLGGGRNIGDAYFDASSQFNFRDLDLALAGPAVSQATAIFQRYWTNRRVRPIEQVAVTRAVACSLDELRRTLEDAAGSPAATAYRQRLRGLQALTELLGEGRVLPAPDSIRIVADPPGKALGRRRPPGMLNAVRNALGDARRQVVLISPYFVPGRRGVRFLKGLLRRGVEISILTNSLAATDVLAVHGGYARYRRQLLHAGIKLHELKRGGQEGRSLFGSGGASLHTKALVVDRECMVVGSFNLDPRSANLNTEMGTFIQDAELSRQLQQEYERLTDPERSWTVALEAGRLVWRSEVEHQRRVLHREPDATLTRRILARVLGWLPIEPQL